MLLALFVLFAITAAVLLLLGYITKESLYSFIAFFLIFSLGNVLLFNNLEYKTGETVAYNYICQSCDGSTFPSPAGNTSQISSTISTYNYSKFTEPSAHYFGLCLAILGGFGFGITWFNYGKRD